MKFKINIEIEPKRYARYFSSSPINNEDMLYALILEDIIEYVNHCDPDIPFDEIKEEVEKLLPEERDPYHEM